MHVRWRLFSRRTLRVHNAGSADSSLHRLLAYTTALHSSLISSVNASLWLIENELVYVSPQCLYKAVKETHTHTHTHILSDAGQTSEPSYCMQRIARACDKSINPLVQRHYSQAELWYFYSLPKKGTADKSGICGDKTTHKASAERTSPVAVIYSRLS